MNEAGLTFPTWRTLGSGALALFAAAALLTGCAGGDTDMEGSDDEDVASAESAIALSDGQAPSVVTAPASATNPIKCVNSLCEGGETWGDSTVGASYHVKAGVGGLAATGYDVWIGAQGDASAALFGAPQKLLDMGAVATLKGGTEKARAYLEVAGKSVFDQSVSYSLPQAGAPPVTKQWSFNPSCTFLDVSKSFYGVTVSAKAVGTLGLNGSVTLSSTGASLAATPSADVALAAMASGNAACVKATVSTNIKLVKVNVPTTASYKIGPSSKTWSCSSTANIGSLAGKLTIKGDVCGVSVNKDIFNFAGFNGSYALVNASGKL